MSYRSLRILLLILVSGLSLRAADIDGTIVVQHKLTKRRVTPTASFYERGVSIGLGSDQQQDPLDFERTHVVIYLEGESATDGVVGLNMSSIDCTRNS